MRGWGPGRPMYRASGEHRRMRTPAPLPHDVPQSGFSVRWALGRGVSKERLRRSDLSAPFRGVRTLTPPVGTVQLATAYAPRLPADGFFSHATAARIWGLPLPPWLEADERIHVSYPNGRRAPRIPGVIGHHLIVAPDELTIVDDLPVTTPGRTWCDLSTILSLEDLVAVGDRLLWFRDPLTTPEELWEMARRYPGRRGARTRTSALPLLSDRSFSPPESIFRVRFVLARFPPLLVNPELYDEHGTFIGMPDILFPDYHEVVDYEGDHHRTDTAQWYKDLDRVPRFEAAGYHSTRAAAIDLPPGSTRLLRLVAAALRAKGWRGEPHF